MCSRYTLTKAQKELVKLYQVKLPPDYEPNYNLAPTQKGLVITADEPERAQLMHFGLVPYWAKSTRLDFSTLNARSEEIMDKKTFAPLVVHRKTCLVLADGFYEWDKKTGDTLPYRFILKDREVFAFAGLWSQWKDPFSEELYRSFTIMTTQANETVGKVYAPKFRMPVILGREEENLWLDKKMDPAGLLNLCDAYPDELMSSYRVDKAVNATVVKGVINNRPELMQAI
ncbi:SOS response-associated peptidase [Pedobacter cryoconitis]|uniref:Abasic site processing protein n=1 Tax=Pedobacter cryoconitis TaxID=188932 RepID=A0A7X0J9M3_9SPHI|nr:SOS response-associated peptidase [Pedobacter cryoconitis]MBB6502482.1 putative SOS response-associated peptidase YedK [Pedobacter cryoconitis]